MAKVFVSSRMLEVYLERKKVVEVLHFLGHTPLFFEREPWVDDSKRAKAQMDRMIGSSDAFIQIHYLTAGATQVVLNDLTPIWYEFTQFERLCGGPCILLTKGKRDSVIDQHLKDLTRRVLDYPGVQVLEFEGNENWGRKLRTCVEESGLETERLEKKATFAISYSSIDYVGLLETIMRVVFQSFGLNISYISYAAAGGFGTLHLICSASKSLSDVEEHAERLQTTLNRELGREMRASKGGRVIVDPSPRAPGAKLSVKSISLIPRDAECYIEVRHMDLPGQMYAICSVIRELGANIDELQLHPVEQGVRKQRVARLWISRPSKEVNEDDSAYFDGRCQELILQLEDRLSHLIGVRAVAGQRLSRGV